MVYLVYTTSVELLYEHTLYCGAAIFKLLPLGGAWIIITFNVDIYIKPETRTVEPELVIAM